jgi:hypothetical protein
MLSPYRGLMHCVVTEWADAVTTDGRSWTLYVRGECLYDDLADMQAHAVTVPDVKYGTWSEKTGFQRAPIRLPTFDDQVCHEGEQLLRAVLSHVDELPFPLADRLELWLLHGETGLPLALIASGCSPAECETPALLRWTPGQLCLRELPQAQALVEAIAELAGDRPRAQWFERQADGSGAACNPDTTGAPMSGAVLAARHFADLQVDAAALDTAQARLLDAVHAWQAPALLQLPGLSRRQRDTFEAAACRHAVRLAEQLPLYPCVQDEAAITAALVEARLRSSSGSRSAAPGGGEALSPYYLETPGD